MLRVLARALERLEGRAGGPQRGAGTVPARVLRRRRLPAAARRRPAETRRALARRDFQRGNARRRPGCVPRDRLLLRGDRRVPREHRGGSRPEGRGKGQARGRRGRRRRRGRRGRGGQAGGPEGQARPVPPRPEGAARRHSAPPEEAGTPEAGAGHRQVPGGQQRLDLGPCAPQHRQGAAPVPGPGGGAAGGGAVLPRLHGAHAGPHRQLHRPAQRPQRPGRGDGPRRLPLPPAATAEAEADPRNGVGAAPDPAAVHRAPPGLRGGRPRPAPSAPGAGLAVEDQGRERLAAGGGAPGPGPPGAAPGRQHRLDARVRRGGPGRAAPRRRAEGGAGPRRRHPAPQPAGGRRAARPRGLLRGASRARAGLAPARVPGPRPPRPGSVRPLAQREGRPVPELGRGPRARPLPRPARRAAGGLLHAG